MSGALRPSVSRQNWHFWTIQNLVDLNHTGLKPRNQSSWQGTRLQEGENNMEESGGKESGERGREMGVRHMGIRDRQKGGQAHRVGGCRW